MTTFKPLEVPRYLSTVIALMLDVIPEDETHLRQQLEDRQYTSLYTAPEAQDFLSVARILSSHFMAQQREEIDWVVKTLKIWRNEEF